MSKKAKSKKGCGLNPICHLQQAAARIQRNKNRTDQIVKDATEGKPQRKYQQ